MPVGLRRGCGCIGCADGGGNDITEAKVSNKLEKRNRDEEIDDENEESGNIEKKAARKQNRNKGKLGKKG
jgi:hypothetical protein